MIPQAILARLRDARHVVVLTGAGVSAESGIPTFRDNLTGLWGQFKAEELASAKAFKADPALVWGWYEWRRMIVMQAQPNPGHRALVALANRVPRMTLITQNVDDLHERAGSLDVLHLHGRLNKAFCSVCRKPYFYPSNAPEEPPGGRRLEPPRCRCGNYIRPGVVWFGEMLPDVEWDAANQSVHTCDALLCVGTSGVVQPAAGLARRATSRGILTIQVNARRTNLDERVSFNLVGKAGEVLPRLLEAVWGNDASGFGKL